MGTAARKTEPAPPDATFTAALGALSEPGPRGAEAFDALVGPLLPALRRYLFARAGEEADDLVADVVLSVLEHAGRFRGDQARFRSWVFTIAHHVAVDRHRRSRPQTTLDAVAGCRSRDDTEGEALGRVSAAQLRSALATLAPAQRDVLMLRVVADLSIEQTAAVLGRTRGAVKALQHRAIEAARRDLAVSHRARD